jgi:tetratricopeptide (TPR) repeat protein
MMFVQPLKSQNQLDNSIFFPVRADEFFNKKDYPKAMEICHEGLESNKDHPDGLFILAQCEQKLGNYKASEKILKSLITSHPIYPEALRWLVNVQKKLNRSENTIKKTENRYNRLVFSTTKKIPKKPLDRTSNKKQPSSTLTTDLKPLNISPKLATFTLVDILENQGLYPQAIDVLELLEGKAKDKKRLEDSRQRILEKLHSQS